jgi:hypothetical protein
MAQGYLIAKPMEVAIFQRWVQRWDKLRWRDCHRAVAVRRLP